MGYNQQPRECCHYRGEEEWHLHYPRSLPYQDPGKASHEGREEEYLWQGSGSEGKASQDDCESLPCGCIEKPNLRAMTMWLQFTFAGLVVVGILRRVCRQVFFYARANS